MKQVIEYYSKLNPPLDPEMYKETLNNVSEAVQEYDGNDEIFINYRMDAYGHSRQEAENTLLMVKLALNKVSLKEVTP